MQNLEANEIVKLSKLAEVSAYPKPNKRQRVPTCLQVFYDEILSVLKVHPDSENNDGTKKFIAKFIEFWKIIYVPTIHADISLWDLTRAAIRASNDENLYKLTGRSNFAKEIAK